MGVTDYRSTVEWRVRAIFQMTGVQISFFLKKKTRQEGRGRVLDFSVSQSPPPSMDRHNPKRGQEDFHKRRADAG